MLLAGSVVVGALLATQFKVMRVDMDSMHPTLASGDWILIRRCSGAGLDARGRIVIALNGDRFIVKRIAAVAGDVVSIMPDGSAVVRRSGSTRSVDLKPSGAVSQVHVPAGYLYLLGDNKRKSVDSRSLGVFPVKSVRGAVIARI